MSDKEKKISVTLFVLAIVFTIIGSTLAYWNWQTSTNDQTNVTFRVTSDFSCGADGGGSITSQQKILAPTDCTNENYAFQRPIVVKPTINKNGKTIYMDLNLKVNQIGEYLSQSRYFRYALTTEPDSCTNGVVASGTFQGSTTNTEIRLLHNKSYSSTTNDQYYLYIWLDKYEENNNTQNQPFDISLTGTCTDEAPTTFTGTIYRYSATPVSIGASIVPETEQVWCIIGKAGDEEFYNSCYDDEWSFQNISDCNNELQSAPDDGNTYSCEQRTVTTGDGLTNYETNASNLNKMFYLKHTIVDDIVTESYVEFVVTSEMAQTNSGMIAGTYTIKGGDVYSLQTNKSILLTAFGSGNCDNSSLTSITCTVSDLRVYNHDRGSITIYDSNNSCNVGEGGTSYCNEG